MDRKAQLTRAVSVLAARSQARTLAQRTPKSDPTRLTDSTFYINLRVDGLAGTTQLIDSNTRRLVGVTNFDGDTLKSGRDLVIDGIVTVYTATGTKVEDASWFAPTAPIKELAGAEIRLKQGNEVLIDLPISDTQGFKQDDYRAISTTPLLKALETFQLELEIPKGVTVPNAAPLFLKIAIRCIQAKKS